MTRRTLYATFIEAEYGRHAGRFWKVPNKLGNPGEVVSLSNCYGDGGYGLTAMLPVLGLLANRVGDRGEGYAWSVQHIARLTGSAPGTIERAKEAIVRLGLARPTLTRRYGKRLTGWADINPALAVPPDRTRGPKQPYFYFLRRPPHRRPMGVPLGPRQAEVTVDALYSVANWLRDEGVIDDLKLDLRGSW